MSWYKLRNADAPWGDYGRMLVSGMGSRQDDGFMDVERAGPFVPPITLVWWDAPIITDAFRALLEASDLRGASFREVRKTRIVKIEWRHWDVKTMYPEKLPPQGEPEAYILGRKHNPQLAEQIGPFWELYSYDSPELATGDFAAAPLHGLLVSDRARGWLAANASEWVRCERADAKPGARRGFWSRLRGT